MKRILSKKDSRIPEGRAGCKSVAASHGERQQGKHLCGLLIGYRVALKSIWSRKTEELFASGRYPIFAPLAHGAFCANTQRGNRNGPAHAVDNFACGFVHAPSIARYTIPVQASKPHHIIALCLGGADAPANMQWMTIAKHQEKTADDVRRCRSH